MSRHYACAIFASTRTTGTKNFELLIFYMPPSIPNLNFGGARFECTFGRGCDGICCRRGRPPIYAEEAARIDSKLETIVPRLRPEARVVIRKNGYLSRRRKRGCQVARVAGGWCIFFNKGCVLHALGAAEGDKLRYKPQVCALFPLDQDAQNRWYVRQWGVQGEIWDLFCLDPKASSRPVAETLQEEIALAQRLTEKQISAREAVNNTRIPKGIRQEDSADNAG